MHSVTPDIWLSNILGFPCYRAESPTNLAEATFLVGEIKRQVSGRAFAYVKVPCSAVGVAALYMEHGYRVVDVGITFKRPPDPRSAPNPDSTVCVRVASATDLLDAREIASQCIVYSRFHLDPRFGQHIGNSVNWAWMDSYCHGQRGEIVYMAEIDGRRAGFIAVLRDSTGPHSFRVIDLIGVRPDFQRRGIGQALMNKFIDDTLLLNLPMKVTTQAANIPAVNLYERNGFQLAESMFVLHKHFP